MNESDWSDYESNSSINSPKSLSDIDTSDDDVDDAAAATVTATATATGEQSYPCNLCSKICKKPWGLRRHVAAMHVNRVDRLCDAMKSMDKTSTIIDILQGMLEEPALGEVGKRRHSVVAELLENIKSHPDCVFVDYLIGVFSSLMSNSSRLFGSLRYEECLKGVNRILNGGVELAGLHEKLMLCLRVGGEANDIASSRMVLFRILHKFLDAIYLRMLKQSEEGGVDTNQIYVAMGEEQQKYFTNNICGLLRSYHSNGLLKFKEEWMKARLRCLREKFVSYVSDSTDSVQQFNNPSEWKENIKLSPIAFKFFLSVESLIVNLQNSSQSVCVESVVKLILEEPSQNILDLWSGLTCMHLSETHSFAFMHVMIGQVLKVSNKAHADRINRELTKSKKLKTVALRTSLKKD